MSARAPRRAVSSAAGPAPERLAVRRSAPFVSAGLLLLLTLTAAQASAAPEPEPAPPRVLVILVPDGPSTGGFAERAGDRAAAEVARAKDLDALELEDALYPKLRAERRQAIAAGVESVARGTAAFVDLDLDTAGAELDTAISTLLAYADELEPPAKRALEDAVFTSGATALFEGQKDLATATFVGLLLVDRDYRPSPELFPTKVIKRLDELRPTLDARATGTLVVSTSPRGADVWVDGSYRGAAPLEVGGLADGQHTVTVKHLGHRPYGTLAPVTAERASSLEVDLEPMPGDDLLALLRPELASDTAALFALGRRLGAARLAFLRLDGRPARTAVSGPWLDVDAGKVLGQLGPLTLVPDADVAGRTLAAALLKSEAAPLVAVPPPPAEPAGALTERWWFWALAGAALVGAGTTAVVLATRGHDDPRLPPGTATLGF